MKETYTMKNPNTMTNHDIFVTIPITEYRMLITALNEADMLRNLFQKHLESNESIYSAEIKTICGLLRIEAKQDA